ncbi:DNA recombination protein RmuC [hydrothermal vent metagenome]|uniref:DNA recombination protein RmuC n=1 Tax=hydrothermal vent metagenome TaxID=652676 RepID=A0A3B0VPZ3_9ZZZZ
MPTSYLYITAGFAAGGLTIWLLSLIRHNRVLRLCRTEQEQADNKIRELQNVITELNSRSSLKDDEIRRLRDNNGLLRERTASLQTELSLLKDYNSKQAKFVEESERALNASFKALAADIMRSNSQSFMMMAKETIAGAQRQNKNELEKGTRAIQELFKPVRDTLRQVDTQLRQVELNRLEAYTSLTEQVKGMARAQNHLLGETASLARALHNPGTRGRWGEIQLRRVVELAGMQEYCDFIEQPSIDNGSGRLRPDMIIKLPNDKEIIVDSKAVLQAYMEAEECQESAARRAKLKLHARQVREQMNKLSAKSYWSQFKKSPEFVILFLPGENFFSAALENDPRLIETGAELGVIIATPTILIALLRAVAFGWRQDKLAGNANRIGELGKILYERLQHLSNHFSEIKKGLDRTIKAYNNAVGSYESRVMSAARKFDELSPAAIPEEGEIPVVEKSPRTPLS